MLSSLLCSTVAASTWGQGVYLPSLGGGSVAVPVTSVQAARLASTIRQQYDFSCGSAAVATLLTHHYGFPVSEQDVFEQMYQRGDQPKIQREGFSMYDMKLFLQELGFEADGFEQSLDKLAEAKVPAIVLINEHGYNHFVVIKGLKDDRVLLGDPASGTRAVPREEFDVSWPNRLLFVIHNRMEQARFNLASDWRAAPYAPLASGVSRGGLDVVTMPRNGPGDF
ncbi:C39 family peptidase [Aquabacterium sp.]|uniref:C39 family peptidase n=1 Tax=Aquabacterium sp. TaxID=1872578 RepID=UPI002E32C171|nr:C39 family peptidase [Aquabacterium sp.]HEX5312729.1 C39 family peptidase [Aquabacterium sp.]